MDTEKMEAKAEEYVDYEINKHMRMNRRQQEIVLTQIIGDLRQSAVDGLMVQMDESYNVNPDYCGHEEAAEKLAALQCIYNRLKSADETK